MLVWILLCGLVCATAPRCAASGRTTVVASPLQNERRVRDKSFVGIVFLTARIFPFGRVPMAAAMCGIREFEEQRSIATNATAGRCGLFCDAGGLCLAANVIGLHVATRAVRTTDAGQDYDDNQHGQDDRDDPRYLHPAWCARVGRQVRHARFLRRTDVMVFMMGAVTTARF